MRHLNGVKQLSKKAAHRKAMFSNMVSSLFMHESIITTKEKAKVLKSISEKLISRAKKNIEIENKADSKALHNKRIVMKSVKDRDAVAKLFDDIALRNKDRKGGYTRIYLLGVRNGDAAQQAMIELVEKSAKTETAEKKEAK